MGQIQPAVNQGARFARMQANPEPEALRLRSGVVVSLTEIAPVVDVWREQTCEAKPSAGVPPHVTLLFPFAPAADLDDELLKALAEVADAFEPFQLAFRRSGRFPGVLFLLPEPDAPLRTLTTALVARFPAWPPYEGAHGLNPDPHLTIAQGDDALLGAVEAELEPLLPLVVEVGALTLLEELEPGHARWRERARFLLAV